MLVRLGKPGAGVAFEHQVFEAVLLAILAFAAFVAVFVDGVNVRFEPPNFRVGIQPAFAGGNERLRHIADRADDVAALVLGQQRMSFALEQADVGIMADYHIEVAVAR